MSGFGTIRGGSGGATAAGIGSAPNQIPGLLVWFCARDRESGPVVTVGTLGQSIPVDFNASALLNRAVYNNPSGSVSHGYGTAYPTPDWSGATANTWPGTVPPTSLFLAGDIGVNRFANGWTFLELWFPLSDPMPAGEFRVQMAYRDNTNETPLAVTGPTIMNYNPAADTGTGFTAVAFDGTNFVLSPTFPVVFGSGWYIVGLGGRAGATMKLRVNGVNSAPQPLGGLSTTGANRIVWGTGGRGRLLEGCVWNRPLADAEYAAVERHWIAKYDNIHLGTAGAPVASGEFRL